jgi:type 1 glutamine amidotransferase
VDVIKYSAPRRLLTIARGHPYERDAFSALFADLDEFDVCHVEQPAAQQLLNPGAAQTFDAILCYDMPGVDFTAADSPGHVPPDPEFQSNYLAMLEAGVGMVYMHHAIAAWPAWPEYADIVGGRFHYRPAALRGTRWPDSGYRHAVTHRVSKLVDHPVTEGLPETFEITDELYLCPVFEDEVVPLLRSDYGFEDSNFYSAAHAVAGSMNNREGWSHPAGSNLVGWVKSHGNSPIVYLQGGDDGSAMANEHFRQLVHNAVRWAGSDAARDWAKARMGRAD